MVLLGGGSLSTFTFLGGHILHVLPPMPPMPCFLMGPHTWRDDYLGKARSDLILEATVLLNAWFVHFCKCNPQEVIGKHSMILFSVLKMKAFERLSHRLDDTPSVRTLCGCLGLKNPAVFFDLIFVSKLDEFSYKITLPFPSPSCNLEVVRGRLIQCLKVKDQNIVLNHFSDILRVRTLRFIRELILKIADIVPFHYFDFSNNGTFLGHFAGKLGLSFPQFMKSMQESQVREFKNLQLYLKAAHIVQVGTTKTNPFRGVDNDTRKRCREVFLSVTNQRCLEVGFWTKFHEIKARSLSFPQGGVDFEAVALGKRKRSDE